jgi:hypothetical protein
MYRSSRRGLTMMIQHLHGTMRELKAQLEYVYEKVVQFHEEIFTDPSRGHLRRVAAASLIRLPDCLSAVAYLADAKLALEAHTIVRTIVELAITLCWMGLDEKRAQSIWDKSADDLYKGLSRAGNRGPLPEEVIEWMTRLRASRGGAEKRPTVQKMAEEALDIPELAGHTMAGVLYEYLFDPLSAASHGDLRFAKLIESGAIAAYVPSALEFAVAATDYLLIAASAQLGFRPDLEKFLDANSRPAPR